MYNKVYDILVILKSLSVNYPILKSLGYGVTNPILIMTGEENYSCLETQLSNFETVRVNEFMKNKDVETVLGKTNSEFIWVSYPETRKGKDFVKQITVAMKSGIGMTKHISAPVVLISSGRIHHSEIENAFIIFLNVDLPEQIIQIDDVVPADEEVTLSIDKIDEYDMRGKTEMEKALLAATLFLYPIMKRKEEVDRLNRMLEFVKELVQQNDAGQFTSDLGETFIVILIHWMKKKGFCGMRRLPNLGTRAEECMKEIIPFDQDFFYLSQELFKDIADPILAIVPEEILKSALADENILYPENSKTFSNKMNYRGGNDCYQRIRMLRFKRAALRKHGCVDIFDIYGGRK